jgi:hypothetical protein
MKDFAWSLSLGEKCFSVAAGRIRYILALEIRVFKLPYGGPPGESAERSCTLRKQPQF